MASKKYKNYKLQKLSDVDILIKDIILHGNFTLNDFNLLLRTLGNCAQPQRIRRKMVREVKPLISLDRIEDKYIKSETINKQIENNKTDESLDFFTRAHKASEFTLEDGIIQIGGYVLQSKRIKSIHSSWLKDIDHDFYIVRDYLFKDSFYFEPPTDLSYMLNAIKNQMEQQEEETERKNFHKLLEKNIEEYFYSYIDISYLNNQNTIPYNQKFLSEFLGVESPTYYYGNRRPKDFLCVPMENVKVKDGIIEITLKNTDIISPSKRIAGYSDLRYPSSDGFINYIRCNLSEDEFIKDFVQEITQYYNNGISKILNSIRERRKVKIRTYITSKSFHYIFKDLKFLTFSCGKDLSIYWSIFNHVDYDRFIHKITAEEFVLKGEAKAWFESFCTKYQSILQKENSELRHRELGIKECFWESSFHGPLYKAKDFYYIRKHHKRLSFCDENKHHVLFFYENMAHYSDDWTHYSPSHTTYIVWSKYKIKNVINLYPANESLSDYEFHINTSIISLQEAAFLLYRFFSSDIKNKRQGFSLNYWVFLKEAGITFFRRM